MRRELRLRSSGKPCGGRAWRAGEVGGSGAAAAVCGGREAGRSWAAEGGRGGEKGARREAVVGDAELGESLALAEEAALRVEATKMGARWVGG